MNIVITARKTTVKDSFKERIEKKLAKFDRFFDDATATVVVTNEKDRETVEITIQSMGMFFRAEKTTGDRIDSLESVTDSLMKQIIRNKSKLQKNSVPRLLWSRLLMNRFMKKKILKWQKLRLSR